MLLPIQHQRYKQGRRFAPGSGLALKKYSELRLGDDRHFSIPDLLPWAPAEARLLIASIWY